MYKIPRECMVNDKSAQKMIKKQQSDRKKSGRKAT